MSETKDLDMHPATTTVAGPTDSRWTPAGECYTHDGGRTWHSSAGRVMEPDEAEAVLAAARPVIGRYKKASP